MATTVIISHLGPRMVFKLAVALPACLLVALIHHEATRTWVVADTDVQPPVVPMRMAGLAEIQAFVRQPTVWGPLVFLFIYNSGPNYDDSLYVYFINQLHFDPYMVGQLVVMHSFAKMLGMFLYRYCLKDIDDRKLIVGLTAISCPLVMMPLLVTTGFYQTLGINPKFLALSGELIREVFIHLQMMPAMARWIQMAPKGAEGTVASFLVATTHVSRAVSKATSALAAYGLGITATNFDNLSVLIIMSGTSCLLPITCAGLIPSKSIEFTSGSDRDQSASTSALGPVAQADDRPALIDLTYELRADPIRPVAAG